MKQWEKPDLKVLKVNMDENIAASGDESRPKASGIMEIARVEGDPDTVNTIMTLTYYTDTNIVIGTNYAYIERGHGVFNPPYPETANSISNAIDDAGCR